MATFHIHSKSYDLKQPKIVEVSLCVSSYAQAQDGSPSITPPCVTEEEVEIQFERVISEIKKKKSEAKAIIRKSDEAQQQQP
jgi:hypothetical protein